MSARDGSHETQAAPLAPQAISDFFRVQVEPEQHPSTQFVVVQSLHTPLVQMPEAQLPHAAPPVPQAAGSVPAWHPVLEQQPFGHEVPSHTQAPFKQRKPSSHGAPAPHRQAPVWLHRSDRIPQSRQIPPPAPQLGGPGARQTFPSQHPFGQEVWSQTQLPATQCWRAAQAGPAPHPHAPAAVQLSAARRLHS